MVVKLIFHLNDNLKRGETLLIEVVRNLEGFRRLIITLDGQNDFSKQELEEIEIVCLHHKSYFTLNSSVRKLKSLIADRRPSLVHAHRPFSFFY